jgi:Right handed beta helix region
MRVKRYTALFVCPLVAAGVGMATTYEAESPVNTMTGATKRSICGPCGGMADVGWIGDGNGPNSTLQFNGVTVIATGQYPVMFYYGNGSPQTLYGYISVNGAAAGTLAFAPTGGWANIGSVMLTVTLNQGGVNTIKISNPSGFTADIDRIDVGNTGAALQPLPPTNNPPVNNPPIVSGGSPSGVLAAGNTQAVVQVRTDIASACKYSTTPGVSYASMNSTFTITGGTEHSTTIAGLQNGGQYAYYVRCMNSAGAADTADYPIAFSISIPVALPLTGNTVSLFSFGPVGNGGDDTAVFQTALNSAAVSGKVLEIPVSVQPYNVQPIYLPSNTNLLVDPGVVVQATSGYGTYQRMVNIADVSNVTINAAGSTFRMRKAEYTNGEYRHCLAILGASNITIHGMTCNDSGGDGLYISGSNQSYSYNVTVEDSTFNNNRRQGFTMTSGQSIYIRRCRFTNTDGTAPQNGIDFEPNSASDRLVDVHIEDSFTDHNAGDGVGIGIGRLTSSSQPVSIVFLRHHSGNNGVTGFVGYYESNGNVAGVPGSILIDQGVSDMNGSYGAAALFYSASGPSLVFQNLIVTNANQSRTTVNNAAIGIKRGGGGIGPMGNVYFLNPIIIDTTGKIDYYYTINDFSNVGETRIQIVNPAQISGALRATSTVWGWIDNSTAASVNIR